MWNFSLFVSLNQHAGNYFAGSGASEYFTLFILEPTPVRIRDKAPNIEVCPCDRYPAIKPIAPAANMPVPIINNNCAMLALFSSLNPIPIISHSYSNGQDDAAIIPITSMTNNPKNRVSVVNNNVSLSINIRSFLYLFIHSSTYFSQIIPYGLF